MYPDLSKYHEIAYDTETTGLNPNAGDRVFGFSISTPVEDYYWDIRETPDALRWLNEAMEAYNGTIIHHNLSFDYRISHATGMHIPLDQAVDTCIQACLINEHEFSYALDKIGRAHV